MWSGHKRVVKRHDSIPGAVCNHSGQLLQLSRSLLALGILIAHLAWCCTLQPHRRRVRPETRVSGSGRLQPCLNM